MTAPSGIPDGHYRIRSSNLSSGDYLAYNHDGSVSLSVANSADNAQIWTISRLNDGAYNIAARSRHLNALLSIGDANNLVCVPNGKHTNWTIEPKGRNTYLIGNAENSMAIHFTRLRVSVFPRNNSPNQRWFLDGVGVDAEIDGSVNANAGSSAVVLASPSVTATFSVYARAQSRNVVRTFYFGTRPLTADDLANYASVQLETDAHNQGWASDPSAGLHSWFEIAILRSVPQTGHSAIGHIKMLDIDPLTWVSHILPLQADYVHQAGTVFDRTHPLWANLEVGDVIGVLACAQFAAWSCEAHRGELRFQRRVL